MRPGVDLKVYAVCISPTMVGVGGRSGCEVSGSRSSAVIGFPSGAHRSEVKADEAARAAADGADEARHGHKSRAWPRAGEWGSGARRYRRGAQLLTGGQILKGHHRERRTHPEEIVGACRAGGGRRRRFRQVLDRVSSCRGRDGRSRRDMAGGGRRAARRQGGWRDS